MFNRLPFWSKKRSPIAWRKAYTIKRLIRMLSAMQTTYKRERTKHYKNWSTTTQFNADFAIFKNKITITAALNIYHELRGSEYRHNFDDSNGYYYRKQKKRIETMLEEGTGSILLE